MEISGHVTGPWNRDITVLQGYAEFSGCAINYSKANLAAVMREPATGAVGSAKGAGEEIRKVTFQDLEILIAPTGQPPGGEPGRIVK